MNNFYSHGKLLITGEYVVLDGALSLAVPTKFGQHLKVEKCTSGEIQWKSLDEKGQIWYEDTFKIDNNKILKQVEKNDAVSNRLLQILNCAKHLNPSFLSEEKGYTITTQLEFPKNWGLGTSSTLIHNIASWAAIDPYELLDLTFGGSGYDIACAKAEKPLSYQINNDAKKRDIKTVSFDPSFKNHLYFVHLNEKQNSRDGIAQYKSNTSDLRSEIKKINLITQNIIDCSSLEEFQQLIQSHEHIISQIIKQNPVKELLFKDFNGAIKSLGAWGGDFVLVASENNPTKYFENKGFSTVIEYDKMLLK
ncbi:MAG: GHMP kinase [Psychroserpens sp.]|nr:GHMP kinase [Psychroserpens sp.]